MDWKLRRVYWIFSFNIGQKKKTQLWHLVEQWEVKKINKNLTNILSCASFLLPVCVLFGFLLPFLLLFPSLYIHNQLPCVLLYPSLRHWQFSWKLFSLVLFHSLKSCLALSTWTIPLKIFCHLWMTHTIYIFIFL